jgi:hypothetical protein
MCAYDAVYMHICMYLGFKHDIFVNTMLNGSTEKKYIHKYIDTHTCTCPHNTKQTDGKVITCTCTCIYKHVYSHLCRRSFIYPKLYIRACMYKHLCRETLTISTQSISISCSVDARFRDRADWRRKASTTSCCMQ